jgi:hypothetical protein
VNRVNIADNLEVQASGFYYSACQTVGPSAKMSREWISVPPCDKASVLGIKPKKLQKREGETKIREREQTMFREGNRRNGEYYECPASNMKEPKGEEK